MRITPLFQLKSLVLISAFALSACGGGGGGSSSGGGSTGGGTPTNLTAAENALLGPAGANQFPTGLGLSGPEHFTRAAVSDAEYLQNQQAFDNVRLYTALQWGIDGSGVNIAMVDTGIDSDHADLASNLNAGGSANAVGSLTVGSGFEDSGSHGTNGAGIAAGNNNGTGMQGVAPGAILTAIRVTNSGSLSIADQIRGMDAARTAGADIINISFGTSSHSGEDPESAINRGAISSDLIDAYKRGIAEDIIYTLPAGNSNRTNPDWDAKLAAYGVSGGHLLAVGALNEIGNDLASFSNHAGEAMNYFIVAPGENLTLTDSDGTLTTGSGTSFAAPFVAGAAALVKSSGPPSLTGKDVVEILLSTTDDMGDPGIDSKFGAGKLNIERALSPVGRTVLRLSSSLDGPQVELAQAGVANDGLVGGVLNSGDTLKNVLFFDKYNRSYTADLGTDGDAVSLANNWANSTSYSNQANFASLGATNSTKLSIAYEQSGETNASINNTRLSMTSDLDENLASTFTLGKDWSTSFKQAGFDGFIDASNKSFLNLTNQGFGAGLTSKLSDKTSLRFNAGLGRQAEGRYDGQQALAMVGADYKLSDKSLVSIDFGMNSEKNQIMGTELGAGFQTGEKLNTNFVTLGLQHQLKPNLSMGMSYSFGQSNSLDGDGFVKNFTGGKLDAAELWMAYQGDKQTFKAGLSRELGYRSGSLSLSLPDTVTYEGDVGTVHFNEQKIDLKAPTVYGAALSYTRDFGQYGALELMGKLKMSDTNTGFKDTSIDAGLKYKLRF